MSDPQPMIDHSLIPSFAEAKLPGAYVAALAALEECERIDEVKDWANQAEAIASYAKQSDDDTLLTLAVKIKARAIRRCGVLLKEIEPRRGANQNIRSAGGPNVETRRSVASEAGLSKRQQRVALRVAEIPDDEFEELVESDSPPSVTKLAKLGTKKKPEQEVPPGYHEATDFMGSLRRLAIYCDAQDPKMIAGALKDHERELVDGHIRTAVQWLELFGLTLGDTD